MRPAWAEVDLDLVAQNAAALRAVASPARLCAVVKADGYGHGAVPVARASLAGGADLLAVALVAEGVELRRAGIEAEVLVLSQASPDELYLGRTGAEVFEFERTASRLIEMQSSDWLDGWSKRQSGKAKTT